MNKVDSCEAVESFLLNVKNILNSKDFDIMKNFYLMQERASYSLGNKHTNLSTLAELDFKMTHVAEVLKNLTISEYKETVIDNQPNKVNPFYCFIKTINGKQVYIKFKLSEVKNNQIFCISFHFVEHLVNVCKLPYYI